MLYVRVLVASGVSDRGQALAVCLPRLARCVQLSDYVVDGHAAGKLIVARYQCSRRQHEIISYRRMGVRVIVHRQAIAVRKRVQIRHRRVRNYVLVAMVLFNYEYYVTKERHAAGRNRLWQDRRIVLESAGRGIQIGLRREHDLIQGQSVLASLYSYCLGAARLKIDQGTEHTRAPAVVLPTPSGEPAAEAVFEVNRCRGVRTNPKDRGSV